MRCFGGPLDGQTLAVDRRQSVVHFPMPDDQKDECYLHRRIAFRTFGKFDVGYEDIWDCLIWSTMKAEEAVAQVNVVLNLRIV